MGVDVISLRVNRRFKADLIACDKVKQVCQEQPDIIDFFCPQISQIYADKKYLSC